MSDIFSSLKISGSGLSVFRRKMNVAAENLANAETTKTDKGEPYQKKTLRITSKKVLDNFDRHLKTAAVRLVRTDSSHSAGKPVSTIKSTNVFLADARELTDPKQNARLVYDPDHPDANAEGFVEMPNVDPLIEMVEMMMAARAYEANLAAIRTIKDMTNKAMDI